MTWGLWGFTYLIRRLSLLIASCESFSGSWPWKTLLKDYGFILRSRGLVEDG